MQLYNVKERMVFSTYVEVIPSRNSTSWVHISILHVCGGDPVTFRCWQFRWMYSPRMWR